LLLECCRLCGGNVEEALPFAAAIEFVHSYSLVHDDLPCMDNSPLRRGKPSVHARFGETMALLTVMRCSTARSRLCCPPKRRTHRVHCVRHRCSPIKQVFSE
jgi:geranylgeranyl pyrophosphate synthase